MRALRGSIVAALLVGLFLLTGSAEATPLNSIITQEITGFRLSERSQERLEGVHPDLVAVVELAITLTMIDFIVLEGMRSVERQITLFAAGHTTTLDSRHLNGYAVDLGAWVGREVRWDWPLYDKIANAMKLAAVELDINIEWGGDWRSFRDGPHFQLPWAEYPA